MFRHISMKALLAGVSLLAFSTVHVQAQSVDYTSLEQMFGEPITTSVTGAPQRASEAAAAISIVTQDDIRRTGADNIPDVLQFVTGIEIRRSGFGQSNVAVRGYDQSQYPRILVLVNGRQVYLDEYGYTDWNSIPVQLSEIRQIEVVKGPASALFGFNAAAGVINIITYDPIIDSTNTATARGGNQSYAQGEGVTTVHVGKTFGARISLGGFVADDYAKPPTGDLPSPRNGRANIDMRWQVTPKVQLRAGVGAGDNRFVSFTATSSYNDTQLRTNDIEAGGALESPIGAIDLDAYRNQARAIYGSGLDSTNIVRVVRLQDLVKLGRSNTFRFALEYRNDAGTSPTVYRGTLSYDDYAATVMWDLALSSKLSFVNAGRVDYTVLHSDQAFTPIAGISQASYNNTTIFEPSFNSGLVYAATDKDTLRLTAARGLQMPSLIDLGLVVQDGPLSIQGNPSLRPTATWNIDLGYDRALPILMSHAAFDAFLQRNVELAPLITASPLIFVPGPAVIPINIGSSNEAGFEIGIKGKSEAGLRWNASYRFEAIGQDITSAVSPAMTTSYADGTPTSAVIAGVGYSTGPWELDFNGRWQSSFTDYTAREVIFATPYQVGSYATLFARVGYDLTRHITVAAVAEQYNEAQIQESAGLIVGHRFFASATIHY